MRIQETEEYRIVKQLTSEENKRLLRKAVWQVPIAMATMYTGMYTFMYLFLWLVKL